MTLPSIPTSSEGLKQPALPKTEHPSSRRAALCHLAARQAALVTMTLQQHHQERGVQANTGQACRVQTAVTNFHIKTIEMQRPVTTSLLIIWQ